MSDETLQLSAWCPASLDPRPQTWIHGLARIHSDGRLCTTICYQHVELPEVNDCHIKTHEDSWRTATPVKRNISVDSTKNVADVELGNTTAWTASRQHPHDSKRKLCERPKHLQHPFWTQDSEDMGRKNFKPHVHLWNRARAGVGGRVVDLGTVW